MTTWWEIQWKGDVGGGGCGGGGEVKPKGILNSNQMQISVTVAVRISNNLEMFAVKVRVVNKRYK